MGVGNKPSIDLKKSDDNINDRHVKRDQKGNFSLDASATSLSTSPQGDFLSKQGPKFSYKNQSLFII